MRAEHIEARVIAVLARAADVPPGSLALDAPLASLGIGSLERIECVLALEDELHVELPEPDLRSLQTVRDLVTAAQRAVAAASDRADR